MDYETIKKENQLLKDENERLKNDLIQIKEHLKKYTAPEYKKVYYENNKEEIKQKHKEYVPTEEQKKKWARTAYLKKKEGMKQEKEKLENQNI
jgi:hypothetical protein